MLQLIVMSPKIPLEHEQHDIFVEPEVEDRLCAVESEAERRHEKALAHERCKAEIVHAQGRHRLSVGYRVFRIQRTSHRR